MVRYLLLSTSLLLVVTSTAAAQPLSMNVSKFNKVRTAQELIAERDDTASENYRLADNTSGTFPESEAGKHLSNHLTLMSTPSPTIDEATKRFEESLKFMKENADEYADVIIQSYWQLKEDDYFQRWALVKLLSDLETSASYDFLSQVAKDPIPAERAKDTHMESTRESEMMIRLRAVFGLSALAQLGNRSAEDDLYQLATENQEGSAIQLRAIKGFLSAGGNPEDRAEVLRNVLPKSLHDVITLQTTDIKEFEQRMEGIKKLNTEDTLSDPQDNESANPDRKAQPPKAQ